MKKFYFHRKWYRIMLLLSIASVLNIAGPQFMEPIEGSVVAWLVSVGPVSALLALPLLLFGSFGLVTFSILTTVLNGVFSFAIIWILIAFEEWWQMKKSVNKDSTESTDNR